jgi:hypothetical protein
MSAKLVTLCYLRPQALDFATPSQLIIDRLLKGRAFPCIGDQAPGGQGVGTLALQGKGEAAGGGDEPAEGFSGCIGQCFQEYVLIQSQQFSGSGFGHRPYQRCAAIRQRQQGQRTVAGEALPSDSSPLLQK